MLFGGIRNKKFIDVGIHFGMMEKGVKEKLPEQTFDFFNRMRFEKGKYEKQWGLPKGIFPKTITETFQANKGEIEGELEGKPVFFYPSFPYNKEGYIRSKEFVMSKRHGGFNMAFQGEDKKRRMHTEKMNKEYSMISFIPTSNYSPKELAKDKIFLQTFGARITKEFNMESFSLIQITKSKNEIFVSERDNIVEYKYPLIERIELHKKDEELEKFIFLADLNKTLKIAVYENEQVKREVKELVN